MLSDGVCTVKAIVSESVFLKMATKPKRFDVVRVPTAKKIEVGKASRDPQWLLNITSPLEVLASSPAGKLGAPQEVNTMDHATADFSLVVSFAEPTTTVEELVLGGANHGDHSSNQSSSGGPTTSANSRASIPATLVTPTISLHAQAAQSSMYMPLKALNTFARDWKI